MGVGLIASIHLRYNAQNKPEFTIRVCPLLNILGIRDQLRSRAAFQRRNDSDLVAGEVRKLKIAIFADRVS